MRERRRCKCICVASVPRWRPPPLCRTPCVPGRGSQRRAARSSSGGYLSSPSPGRPTLRRPMPSSHRSTRHLPRLAARPLPSQASTTAWAATGAACTACASPRRRAACGTTQRQAWRSRRRAASSRRRRRPTTTGRSRPTPRTPAPLPTPTARRTLAWARRATHGCTSAMPMRRRRLPRCAAGLSTRCA